MKKRLYRKTKKIGIMVVCLSMGLFLNACSGIKSFVKTAIKEAMEEEEEKNKKRNKNETSWEEDINHMYRVALENGSIGLVKDCWENGADKNDLDGEAPVYIALARDQTKLAMWLLDEGSTPNYQLSDGDSLIMKLTDSWNYELCEKMIECGADINYVNKKGRSVLETIADRNTADTSIVKLFIEHGAKLTTNAIQIGLESNQSCDVVRYMVQVAKKQGIKTGLNPVVEAAILGETDKVRSMVGKKLTTNEKKLLLVYTAAYGTADTLKLLESKGIRYHFTDYELGNYEEQLASYAIENGNASVLQYLFDQKEFSLAEDKEGYWMEQALESNAAEVAQVLLKNGADINNCDSADSYGRCVGTNGNYELWQFLLDNGYNVNIEDRLYYTLVDAASHNQLDFIKKLVEDGYDCNSKDADGTHTLLTNAHIYTLDMIKYLVEQGADVNGVKHDGCPLSACIEDDCTESAIYLIEQGADVNLVPGGADTNLYNAVEKGNLTLVKLLLEKGVDINEPCFDRYPLMYATEGHTILECLLKAGANVEVQTEEEHDNALMLAANYGNIKAIQLLLDAGADVTVKNKEGLTAYDIAVKEHNVKSAEMLKEAMES